MESVTPIQNPKSKIQNRPTRLAILGSTGSIGTQALEVVRWHPSRLEVVALAARSDSAALRAQVAEFAPALAAVVEAGGAEAWPWPRTERLVGEAALEQVAAHPDVDLVLVAPAGKAGLRPTLAALRAGKRVALANKEALVMAGHLVMAAAREHGSAVLPVDSEHSALWQCLRGEEGDGGADAVRRVTLTASGGAFRDVPREHLAHVTPEQALQHPTWQMGPKITVDSATLMNKGLEVLEASWLFDLDFARIEIVLHRESIIHALVEFIDGSVKAQLAVPDMRLPIQCALTYPERLETQVQSLDLARLGRLTFEAVDRQKYPAPFLAYEAGQRGGTYPAVLNAANEQAVQLFLSGCLRFDHIPRLIEQTLHAHVPALQPSLEQVLAADAWAREHTRRLAFSSR
ncbi:MAG: 1-deoxy-D-xylulose-5-phosphate reductoisomerase [Chloroflexi bacterium]|nr:1-deoxy-D-xylulose-5-phosphate reductoisomerase [Chloroflexota bacterium]